MADNFEDDVLQDPGVAPTILPQLQSPQPPSASPMMSGLPADLQSYVNQALLQTPQDLYRKKLRELMGLQDGEKPKLKNYAQGFLTNLLRGMSHQPNLQKQALQEYQEQTGRLGQAVGEERANNVLNAMQMKIGQQQRALEALNQRHAETLAETAKKNASLAKYHDALTGYHNDVVQLRKDVAEGRKPLLQAQTELEKKKSALYDVLGGLTGDAALSVALGGGLNGSVTPKQQDKLKGGVETMQRLKNMFKPAPQPITQIKQIEIPNPNGEGTIPAMQSVSVPRSRAAHTLPLRSFW